MPDTYVMTITATGEVRDAEGNVTVQEFTTETTVTAEEKARIEQLTKEG